MYVNYDGFCKTRQRSWPSIMSKCREATKVFDSKEKIEQINLRNVLSSLVML